MVADNQTSLFSSASSMNGPNVGRLNTTETITLPPMSAGSSYPRLLMNGFNATRRGYLTTSFQVVIPLA